MQLPRRATRLDEVRVQRSVPKEVFTAAIPHTIVSGCMDYMGEHGVFHINVDPVTVAAGASQAVPFDLDSAVSLDATGVVEGDPEIRPYNSTLIEFPAGTAIAGTIFTATWSPAVPSGAYIEVSVEAYDSELNEVAGTFPWPIFDGGITGQSQSLFPEMQGAGFQVTHLGCTFTNNTAVPITISGTFTFAWFKSHTRLHMNVLLPDTYEVFSENFSLDANARYLYAMAFGDSDVMLLVRYSWPDLETVEIVHERVTPDLDFSGRTNFTWNVSVVGDYIWWTEGYSGEYFFRVPVTGGETEFMATVQGIEPGAEDSVDYAFQWGIVYWGGSIWCPHVHFMGFDDDDIISTGWVQMDPNDGSFEYFEVARGLNDVTPLLNSPLNASIIPFAATDGGLWNAYYGGEPLDELEHGWWGISRFDPVTHEWVYTDDPTISMEGYQSQNGVPGENGNILSWMYNDAADQGIREINSTADYVPLTGNCPFPQEFFSLTAAFTDNGFIDAQANAAVFWSEGHNVRGFLNRDDRGMDALISNHRPGPFMRGAANVADLRSRVWSYEVDNRA